MNGLIGNNFHYKYCSKLLNDSLTIAYRHNYSRAKGESGYISSYIFWIPLSWIQCCDIYFSIKEFLQHWIICWDKQWFKNTFNHSNDITNIEIDTLKIMIAKIETLVSQIVNHKQSKSINKMQTMAENDGNMFSIFECCISQIKNILASILPRLTKLNNFIDFFAKIYYQGMRE